MKNADSRNWDNVTWAGAEKSRRMQDARLSFRQKLEWNAQALELAKRFETDRSKAPEIRPPSHKD
jgi:hypothetical protein